MAIALQRFTYVCFLVTCTSFQTLTAQEQQQTPNVDLVGIEQAYRMVTLIGFTRANAEIQVIPEASGRCTKIVADVGDVLPSSGLFATLDDTFVALEIENNRVRQKSLKSSNAYLERELKRSQELHNSQALSASELDRLQQDYDQSTWQLATLKTEEKILLERQARHRVKAQPNWRIISRSIEPGQWVQAGQPIARAGDYSSLLVPLSLTFQEYETLSKQKQVKVRLTDLNTTVTAVYKRSSPGFDATTRKIQVELELKEGVADMRGGLRVELDLATQQLDDVFFIQNNAITKRYDSYWLTRENGEPIEVTVLGDGPNDSKRVRASQISAGDRFRAREGM